MNESGNSSSPPIPLWTECRPSPIHGLGLVARQPVPAGTRLLEYVGERISKQESLKRCEQQNNYIFSLDDEHDLDGNVPGNEARWINHSCRPNCEAVLEEGRIWIVAVRDIAAGEEITFNYGYDLVDFEEHPCRCGAPGCAGYMVDEAFFDAVRSRGRHSVKQRSHSGIDGTPVFVTNSLVRSNDSVCWCQKTDVSEPIKRHSVILPVQSSHSQFL
ncbi:MAG: SET domain-containing protein-lysine N-methyltransferase [Verrucomicrobiota bacterium]